MQDSLSEAKRSSNAAIRSVEQSREIADSEIRPWLSIRLVSHKSTRANEDYVTFFFEFELENFGKFPALGIQLLAHGHATNFRAMITNFDEGRTALDKRSAVLSGPTMIGSVAFPGQKIPKNCDFSIPTKLWDRASQIVSRGGVTIFMTVRATYKWSDRVDFTECEFQLFADDGHGKRQGFDASPEVAAQQNVLYVQPLSRIGPFVAKKGNGGE